MNKNYFRLKVLGLARESEDEFTNACFETGAEGVSEDLKFVQRDLRYDPDVIETPHFDMNVFFTRKPDEKAILQLQTAFPTARFEFLEEENRDWLEEWKKGFEPFLFAHPFWVVPSWLEAPTEIRNHPEHIIFVEPGMAFGTGTHETTRLAAALLIEELAKNPATSLIDVGTGTGILALVASRLGVSRVVGLDNDPEARRTARENLERNTNRSIAIPDSSIEEETAKYDIVVANIIDGVLTLLRHDLKRALKPGGSMILSGVLIDREDEFYAHFQAETGLKLVKKIKENEWTAAILV